MTTFDQLASNIVKEQALIIGPLAWKVASTVSGIHITDVRSGVVTVSNGDNKTVIDKLVNQYEFLFGRASREVCKEAAMPLLSQLTPTEVPLSLK